MLAAASLSSHDPFTGPYGNAVCVCTSLLYRVVCTIRDGTGGAALSVAMVLDGVTEGDGAAALDLDCLKRLRSYQTDLEVARQLNDLIRWGMRCLLFVCD